MQNQPCFTGPAFGQPGIEPRWARSDKEAIITAYSASSPIWATLSAGIVNEVYYPTIDQPQIRDLQYLVTDGKSFFHDERRDMRSEIQRLSDDSLGFRVTNLDPQGRYRIEKQIITAPHAACLLIQTRFAVSPEWEGKLKLFALIAPHLNIGGCGNSGNVERRNDRILLTAYRDGKWLAMDCSTRFVLGSCGYVGRSDGWTDLADNFKLDWEYTSAPNGNIAMIGEIDLPVPIDFVLAVGFGRTQHEAVSSLMESLAIPFDDHLGRFHEQWKRTYRERTDSISSASMDGGNLFRTSHALILAHEDKCCHGAMIASLSIPWGEAKGDEELGGYHLVWTRDLVNSATGLLACGETETPFRALIYLASAQLLDGGFHQNFWIDGHPYWKGIQLDEVAFPIILAWRLKQVRALRQFDPYPMVKAAACYLVRHGPATPQDRWEENSGYSPSTLAAHIAGLICASQFAIEQGEPELANYFTDYADFLEQHIERWTVTDRGTILSNFPRHFIRMLPIDLTSPAGTLDPNTAQIGIKNRAADLPSQFPAREIVDAGFLELVRYGIRSAGDKLFEDSLKVTDHVLKVELPGGPCWRRYSFDGYGQRTDGGPFVGVGQGRVWPLLTGERAHYELAKGCNVDHLIRAMEEFAGPSCMFPEQAWDMPDMPAARMFFGRPTGSAMPLMWAHSEYIKLLRSKRDDRIFDRIDVVYDRYSSNKIERRMIEIWKFNHQPVIVDRQATLRIQADTSFRLRFTLDDWTSHHDLESQSPGGELHFVDLESLKTTMAEFTFWWLDAQRWEERNYSVALG